MPLNKTIKQVHRLQHVQQQLKDPSSGRLIPARYDWMQKRLDDVLPGAVNFFERQKQISDEKKNLVLYKKKSNALVRKLTAGYLLLCRGMIKISEDEKKFEKLSPQGDMVQRANDLVSWIETNRNYFAPLLDKKIIDIDLLRNESEKLNHYRIKIVSLGNENNAAGNEFLKKEDVIDDLYHEVCNVLEGLFHDDDNYLHIFLPHRGKKVVKNNPKPFIKDPQSFVVQPDG